MRNVFTPQLVVASNSGGRAHKRRKTGGVARSRATLAVLTLLAASAAMAPAIAGGKSRVVVASPTPGGTEIPIAPNEKVGAATGVELAGGIVFAVIRVDQMPPKPRFNVISESGVSHPYTNDENWSWTTQSIHNPDGTEDIIVTGRYKNGGTATINFPNSRVEPDPPQPPGLVVWCTDGVAVLPHEEALVLATLGMVDLPGPQVWHVPSGDFLLQHDAISEPEVVNMCFGPLQYAISARHGAGTSIPSPAVAALWSEKFDSYGLGSSMHGQGGWKGWGDDPSFDAVVTDAQARSAPHAVDVVDAADLVHEYEDHASGKWVYTAWQYIPSDFVGGQGPQLDGSFFVMLNTYSDAGPYEDDHWSVQLNFDSNDGMLKVYYGNGMNTVDVPYDTDRWVEIQVAIDLDDDWTEIYYDDTLITGYSWTGGVLGGGAGALDVAAVDLYANGSTSIYYDNFSLRPAR